MFIWQCGNGTMQQILQTQLATLPSTHPPTPSAAPGGLLPLWSTSVSIHHRDDKFPFPGQARQCVVSGTLYQLARGFPDPQAWLLSPSSRTAPWLSAERLPPHGINDYLPVVFILKKKKKKRDKKHSINQSSGAV